MSNANGYVSRRVDVRVKYLTKMASAISVTKECLNLRLTKIESACTNPEFFRRTWIVCVIGAMYLLCNVSEIMGCGQQKGLSTKRANYKCSSDRDETPVSCPRGNNRKDDPL